METKEKKEMYAVFTCDQWKMRDSMRLEILLETGNVKETFYNWLEKKVQEVWSTDDFDIDNIMDLMEEGYTLEESINGDSSIGLYVERIEVFN